MISTNIKNSEVRSIIDEMGAFSVLEYNRDVSVISPAEAASAYFSSMMNLRRRQVICSLDGTGVIMQAGAMQMMVGNIEAETNVKGAGDLLKKAIGSKVTGESAIKPRYTGRGLVVLEPTYKHVFMENISDWKNGIVIDDGLFLACDDTVKIGVQARQNISSAAMGREGLFNTVLKGDGVAVFESPYPRSELVEFVLTDDVIKIDGNMAVAWSASLQFTTERTTATLIGSAASGEGLVNVYRGTGRILVAPVQ